jgi:hypothetical protein
MTYLGVSPDCEAEWQNAPTYGVINCWTKNVESCCYLHKSGTGCRVGLKKVE